MDDSIEWADRLPRGTSLRRKSDKELVTFWGCERVCGRAVAYVSDGREIHLYECRYLQSEFYQVQVDGVVYVLTERLRQCYWPEHLAQYYSRHDPRRPGPISQFVEENSRHNKKGYDVQRVRFFLREIRSGKLIDPIVVETYCDGYRAEGSTLYYPPEVKDGHHRFVAAVLAGLERIPIIFGGPVDYLNWLKGGRKTMPDL